MANVVLPLLSGSASGSVAGALTFTNKFGKVFAGKKITRNLSNSATQTKVRNLMSDVATHWNALSSGDKTAFKNKVNVPGMTGYTVYQKAAFAVNNAATYNGTYTAPSI